MGVSPFVARARLATSPPVRPGRADSLEMISMIRLSRPFASLALAASSVFLLAGCGGSGGKEDTATTSSTATAPAGEQDKGGAGGGLGQDVTPVRGIDPKGVVDVVKAEVKGGESEKGPTRIDHLYAYPDAKLIQDEPLEVESPPGFPGVVSYLPASNPLTKGRVELGKQLYFDPRMSADTTVSCATCHDPAKGWTDNQVTSVGIFGQVGARNAPTVLNTAYGRSMFWDGRAPSLEGQAQGPIQNKIEMGDQSYEEIIDRLRAIPGYRDQFRKVFGTDVTLDGMAKAIASFERVAAISANSPFDKYKYSSDEDPDRNKAMTDSQKRGMVLFGLELNDDDEFKTDVVLKKANCTACHSGFNFSDERFHNLGVGWVEETKEFKDPGRWGVTATGAKDPAELGAFKTPTCRDVEKTGPYMHDGSEATLEAVVEYYDRGGNVNPTLDRDMKPLKLTTEEKADLVAFLKGLTGTPAEVSIPDLPPGPDGTSPDPKDALAPPAKATALRGHFPTVR